MLLLLKLALLAEAVREGWLLIALPKRAERHFNGGDLQSAARLMSRAAWSFAPFNLFFGSQWAHRYRLAQMLSASARHAEAVDAWRKVLTWKLATPAFQADVRRRLADDLEVLGDLKSATQERATAAALLEGAGASEDWYALLQLAKQHETQRDFENALNFYERAMTAPRINMTLSDSRKIDVEIEAARSLCAHNAGRFTMAEESARHALEGASTVFWKSTAQKCLSLALSGQNRMDEAVEEARLAVRIQESGDDPALLADARSNLATQLMQRGDFEAALEECRAASDYPGAMRVAGLVAADIHALKGEWQDAREAISLARGDKTVLTNPAAERLQRALCDFAESGIEAQAAL